jgi:hypothetical protein
VKVELLNWNIDHISDPILIKEKHSPERPQLHHLAQKTRKQRDKHQKNLGRTNQNQRVMKKEKKTVNAFLWSHLFWNP